MPNTSIPATIATKSELGLAIAPTADTFEKAERSLGRLIGSRTTNDST
jgi:hypothetical protein